MPLSPRETQALLASLGHEPRHRLGQNFLTDGNIVHKALELGKVRAGDRVLEVGPGLGTLTRALLERGAHVWAVEMDVRLHDHLAAALAPDFPNTLHLMLGDAMDFPRAGMPDEAAMEGFKILANLPYAISTPWLDAILAGPLPECMVLMLQLEAAQRYGAVAGSKTFGAISIFLSQAYHVDSLHKVNAACFHPRPAIESALLPLRLRADHALITAPTRALIRRLFQQRRKQLGSLLRQIDPTAGEAWWPILTAAGYGPTSRPEQVPAKLWAQLSAST